MRRLGIDPGSRRTGLALAEADVPVAVPHATVGHTTPAQALDRICEVVRAEGVEELVVGLPLRLDGGEGEAARRARKLAEQLEARLSLPVVLWDERLSSVAAERALREQGVRGQARRAVVDQAAATILLQSYLDSRAPATSPTEHDWDVQLEPDPGGRDDRAGRRRGKRGRRR